MDVMEDVVAGGSCHRDISTNVVRVYVVGILLITCGRVFSAKRRKLGVIVRHLYIDRLWSLTRAFKSVPSGFHSYTIHKERSLPTPYA